MLPAEVITRFCQMLPDLYLGLKPGQAVMIHASRSHQSFFQQATEALLRQGHREILAHLVDPARQSVEEICARQQEFNERSLQLEAAYVKITGPEGPDFYEGLSAEDRQRLDTVGLKAGGEYRRRLMAGLIQRCLLPGPTTAWGALVYPELNELEAEKRLATDLAEFCFLDQEDPEKAFLEFDEILERARVRLQEVGARSLLLEGWGTRLKVNLSPRALWLGGRKWTPEGIRYFANVPLGEVFTTPEAGGTEGIVNITLPTRAGGIEVSGLRLEFHQGRLAGFEAAAGGEAFARLLESDGSGAARHLGEIALVSMDSPVCRGETVYREILVDEKRRSHLALGEGYTNTISGGPAMSREELRVLGVNHSSLHHDLMIGSSQLRVTATTPEGKQIRIMENGCWTSL